MCFKFDNWDKGILVVLALLVLVDGPFTIGDGAAGAIGGGRFAPLVKPVLGY
jgi:hypothetical protein